MTFLSSFNFIALILGYISMLVVVSAILFFVWVILKDKYIEGKRQKEHELMKKQKEQEERQKSLITKEAPKDAPKEDAVPQAQETNNS